MKLLKLSLQYTTNNFLYNQFLTYMSIYKINVILFLNHFFILDLEQTNEFQDVVITR